MESPNFKRINTSDLAEAIVRPEAKAAVKLCSPFNGASQLLSVVLAEFEKQYVGKIDFYLVNILSGPRPRNIVTSKIDNLLINN